MSSGTPAQQADSAHDTADLARFGYKQELRRRWARFSSFAVAFSYISPSTGIFTLYALGLSFIGPAFFWTWPLVFMGQLMVALNWAELSSHYPVAGSVFQWTKYLAGRRYAWFTGWIYLWAGVITVTAVVVTVADRADPRLQRDGHRDGEFAEQPAAHRGHHPRDHHGAEHLRRAGWSPSSTTPAWSSRSWVWWSSPASWRPSTTARAPA